MMEAREANLTTQTCGLSLICQGDFLAKGDESVGDRPRGGLSAAPR